MQAASQNQLAAYYMGIPVKRMFSLIWAISAGVAAIAGVLLAPVSLIDINLGFIGLKAFAAAVLGGFGSIPGALVGGVTIGLIELVLRHLPAARGEGRGRLRRAAAGARRPSPGHVRHGAAARRSEPPRCASRSRPTYEQDLGLFRDPVQRRWYAALLAAVLLLPLACARLPERHQPGLHLRARAASR